MKVTIELDGAEFIALLNSIPEKRMRAKVFHRMCRRLAEGETGEQLDRFDQKTRGLAFGT
jgi:hypothetical protein